MSDKLREALRVPKELVREICADVMVGTYGIQGSLTQAHIDVTNRIEKWVEQALTVAHENAGQATCPDCEAAAKRAALANSQPVRGAGA